jgi:hypothetical protein
MARTVSLDPDRASPYRATAEPAGPGREEGAILLDATVRQPNGTAAA